MTKARDNYIGRDIVYTSLNKECSLPFYMMKGSITGAKEDLSVFRIQSSQLPTAMLYSDETVYTSRGVVLDKIMRLVNRAREDKTTNYLFIEIPIYKPVSDRLVLAEIRNCTVEKDEYSDYTFINVRKSPVTSIKLSVWFSTTNPITKLFSSDRKTMYLVVNKHFNNIHQRIVNILEDEFLYSHYIELPFMCLNCGDEVESGCGAIRYNGEEFCSSECASGVIVDSILGGYHTNDMLKRITVGEENVCKTGDKVKFIREVSFDYGDGGAPNVVAKIGDIKKIESIDKDGYWFDVNNFYIEVGFEDKYFKLVK